ncbi:N-acetyl-gamma-glutamyl-phosphate reductase [Gracilibacillus halotolerans]|uniref:N-acetyl-gamma-glutamyl-phosphate reductase n=1 Tax=Gracilibacillus halotolerans TaxID=74386 RepID=A0A841RPB4_9BACI|nr:N-acetyl-gamma-glutamyl-phosphate reductase [Gracilibacillus halotolerans]
MDVAIIGGTGYGAAELIRLLHHHPQANVKKIISQSNSGVKMSEVYPHLTNIMEIEMEDFDAEALAKEVDVVFFATPSNVSKHRIPELLDLGVKVIDLSGDFRLTNRELYKEYYGEEMASDKYVNQAVYGLSEIYREEIRKAALIANPGCYPTSVTLGLMPLIDHQWTINETLIIDAKTGVSGAGRSLSLNVHYSEMNENMKAYGVGKHKHIPEIEQILTDRFSEEVQVVFTPHIVPMTRGILSTMYVDLKDSKNTAEVIDLYEQYYKNDPFVRIRKEGVMPATKEVYGSNYCDIGLYMDERTNKLIVVSVIDNLVKGAAGQAVQNMNIMFGLDDMAGLELLPTYP